jgi:hypothetical protein
LAEPSNSLNFFLGGSLSFFGGDPQAVVDSMNGFLELSEARVFASSGFSPLRSIYEALRDIHFEGGVRLGDLSSEGEGLENRLPWYTELKVDWSRSTLLTFPSLFRVMPGVGFQIQERWRASIEPEFWLAETGDFDWVVSLGFKVGL